MPKEPPTNSFLEPLVEELEAALQGFMLKSLVTGKEECYRLDLLCVDYILLLGNCVGF